MKMKCIYIGNELQLHVSHCMAVNCTYIFLGGDQLTVARVRGSQGALLNSDSGIERVEVFIPVIEDWHTKMCYMKACSTCLMVCTVYTSI